MPQTAVDHLADAESHLEAYSAAGGNPQVVRILSSLVGALTAQTVVAKTPYVATAPPYVATEPPFVAATAPP